MSNQWARSHGLQCQHVHKHVTINAKLMGTISWAYKKFVFLKMVVFETIVLKNDIFIKLVVSSMIVNDDPWLMIVNDEPLLTIFNDDPLLTIVNDDPLLTIFNDDPLLTIMN